MSQIYCIWSNTLHVSDGLSVGHQEFKTVHTATGMCQPDTADCLIASSRQYLVGFTTETYKFQCSVVKGKSGKPPNCMKYDIVPDNTVNIGLKNILSYFAQRGNRVQNTLAEPCTAYCSLHVLPDLTLQISAFFFFFTESV